jgi:hypothetical protein
MSITVFAEKGFACIEIETERTRIGSSVVLFSCAEEHITIRLLNSSRKNFCINISLNDGCRKIGDYIRDLKKSNPT